MRKHSGMRPQDIVILLSILSRENEQWRMKDHAIQLNISASEISESLNRSSYAKLINSSKTKVNKEALLEFLFHGLAYVFPQHPGAITRGIATAFSAPPLNRIIRSSESLVWPYAKGNLKGQSIAPLYAPALDGIIENQRLYEMLALTDALRIGRVREKELAKGELKKRFFDGE